MIMASTKAKRPSSKAPEISIVVPVMNEEGNIAPLISDILAAFKGRNIEIVYVDDASTDNTANELAALKKKTPQLRVLTHGATMWSKRCSQNRYLRSKISAYRHIGW